MDIQFIILSCEDCLENVQHNFSNERGLDAKFCGIFTLTNVYLKGKSHFLRDGFCLLCNIKCRYHPTYYSMLLSWILETYLNVEA